jgi:hypothetical protein
LRSRMMVVVWTPPWRQSPHHFHEESQ